MQWTSPQEGHVQELPKQKISSQEEISTINEWEEGYPGGPLRVMDQGKSSHASFVENRVTSHEIADRNDTAIRALHETIKDQLVPLEQIKIPYEPDKSARKKATSG
jgi:hypothetical protein